MTIANMQLASRIHNRLNRDRAKNVVFNTMDMWIIGGCNTITEDGIHVQGLIFMFFNEIQVNLLIYLFIFY